MAAGKLTIQAWHEKEQREAEWQRKRDAQLAALGHAIDDLTVTVRRGLRRRPSILRRFIRSINLGL